MASKDPRSARLSRDKSHADRGNWSLDALESQPQSRQREVHPGEVPWPAGKDLLDETSGEDEPRPPERELGDEIWDVFCLDDEPPPEPEWGDFDYEPTNQEEEID